MERIFCDDLIKILEQHIKGKVKATVVNDVLIVDIIYNKEETWWFTLTPFGEKVMQGLSSTVLAQNIFTLYKRKISEKYFK